MTRQSGKTLMAESFEELRQIWTDEGDRPHWHRTQQMRLRDDWPAMYEWMIRNFGPPKPRG